MTWVSAEYQAQHATVYKAFGKAKEYRCTDCNNAAADWSFDRDGDPWSVDDYWPRCRRCHLLYDSDLHRPTVETKAKIALALTGHKRSITSRTKQSTTRTGLIESDILEIRRLHNEGHMQSIIADMFNTSRMTINRIVNRKTWTHV